MLQEFRKFIMRGNVLDLAVGIIIGVAFTSIVNSLVNDIIMPPIGLVLGGVDFSQIKIVLQAAAGDKPEVAINIGLFINALISFLIISFVVFLLIRGFNQMMERLQKKEEAPKADATTKDCPYCYSIINIKATRCPNCTSEIKA
ncbi:MAG: large-conductance mechanosensitive channel protein MscL [Anaerolineae bacterium]|nr:large-conductance mechanosensitive channel protein MscL [Anaerolineae bacterium]